MVGNWENNHKLRVGCGVGKWDEVGAIINKKRRKGSRNWYSMHCFSKNVDEVDKKC